jgi:hypothetical protein
MFAATTPVNERGYLERLPDGGELILTKFWLPIGPRQSLAIPVEHIDNFRYEVSEFQDSVEDKYHLARLWVVMKTEETRTLTRWHKPDAVKDLGDALAKACRCTFVMDAVDVSS